MCSCWSWCILLCPSAVALWRVYCRLGAGGQPSIIYRLSAARDTGTYPCIPSTTLSHIQFHSSSHLNSFSSTSPVCSCPFPHHHHHHHCRRRRRHHRHPWLWSCDIHFCHSCPSALILPQGDKELRAVTDKFLFSSWCWVKGTARCRAPLSVWCSRH